MPDGSLPLRLQPLSQGLIALTGLIGVGWCFFVKRGEIYDKDLVYEYLLGRAVLDRANPYASISELASRSLPGVSLEALHPHNLPPFVAVISAPLGLLPFPAASALWFLLELGLLAALARLLFQSLPARVTHLRVLCTFLILVLWTPVSLELSEGQLQLALAVLLLGSLVAARSGRNGVAGLLLGFAVAIKLFPLAVVGVLLLQRRFAIVFWSIATAAALTIGSMLIVGPEAISSYLALTSASSRYWLGSDTNHSIPAAAWRTFAGSHLFAPLIDYPALAWPAAGVAALSIIVVVVRLMRRPRGLDATYAAGIGAMLLLSPVVWQHYYVLLIWPIWMLGVELRLRGWPSMASSLLVGAVALLAIPLGTYILFWTSLSVTLFTSLAPNGEASRAELLRLAAAGQPLPGIWSTPYLLLLVGPLLLGGLIAWHVANTGLAGSSSPRTPDGWRMSPGVVRTQS
jgi:hypothetical protein